MSKYLTKAEKEIVINLIESQSRIKTCRLVCINGGYPVIVSPEISGDYASQLEGVIRKNCSVSINEKILSVINEHTADDYIKFWKKPYNLVDGKKEYWKIKT